MALRIIIVLFLAPLLGFGDINDDLLTAARRGELTQVKALVDKGADINTKTAYGVTPLYAAAMNGHAEVVKFLAEKGADVNVRDTFYKGTAISIAAQKKHAEVVKVMLDHGAKAEPQMIQAAINFGSDDLARALIEKGGLKGSALNQALALAVSKQKTELAELLKKAGAEPPPPEVKLDDATLALYTGDYRNKQTGLEVKVTVRGGKLIIQAAGQPELQTVASSSTEFSVPQYGVNLKFNVKDGKAASMSLQQGAFNVELEHVEAK